MMTKMVIVGTCEDQMPERSGIETIAFLCDEHDRAGNIKAVDEQLKDNNPESAPGMGTLTCLGNKESPAIQAVDLLAGNCKEFVTKSLECSRDENFTDEYKSLFGRNVGIFGMDKRSFEFVVDANAMKDGKPSI